MKEKKTVFKSIKDALSRDEMKAVMAGSGSGCPSCTINGATMGCYQDGNIPCRCGLTGNPDHPQFRC